jgi:hypothetical protein
MKLHFHWLLLLATQSPTFINAQPSRSSKRGLVYVSTPHSTQDDNTWTQPNSDLTWYYNYSPYPNPSYPHLNFVPMLFSIPTDTSWINQTTTLLDSTNTNTTHILAFNEPDGPTSQGGTALSPSSAAKSYLDTLAPLLKSYPNLQLGLPAVTGSPRGLTWLSEFNKSCHSLSSSGCPASFIPIHWYGDFASMASYIGEIRSRYPKLPIWVTEFADPDVGLVESQGFFNQSVSYLDGLAYVERYAYFGSFRSQDSNVGKEGVMLDKGGALTSVGEWYLGLSGVGRDPGSGGGRVRIGSLWMGLLGVVVVLLCGL